MISNDTELKECVINYVKYDFRAEELAEKGDLKEGEFVCTIDDTDMPFMPVGSIFTSAIPQTDARVHLLDGSTISQTGIYADFANLIKALVSTGNLISCTQAQFDADVSTYGQCGKFVVDNNAGTIRLPRITEFIASNNGGQMIGLAQLDEFKSHNHAYYGWATVTDGSGSYQVAGDQPASTNTSHTTRDRGGSETRPKNIRYPYYIVLASGYKSSQVIDIDNIMNDVNAKLSLTGGTMTGVLDINNPSNDTKGINIKNADSSAMMSFIRTDNGNAISVGIGSGGVNRGVYDEKLGYWLMHTDGSKLKLKGPTTRPTYNDNDMALYSDLTVKHGYKTLNSNYWTGTCNWWRIGQMMFVYFDTIIFTKAPPDPNSSPNLLTSVLPKPLVNTIFMLVPHTAGKPNARMCITAYAGYVVGWWPNLTLNENYQGFIGYVVKDGE